MRQENPQYQGANAFVFTTYLTDLLVRTRKIDFFRELFDQLGTQLRYLGPTFNSKAPSNKHHVLNIISAFRGGVLQNIKKKKVIYTNLLQATHIDDQFQENLISITVY